MSDGHKDRLETPAGSDGEHFSKNLDQAQPQEADAGSSVSSADDDSFMHQPAGSQDHGDMVRVRKRTKAGRKKRRTRKIVLIVIAILALAGGGIAFAIQFGRQQLLAQDTGISVSDESVSYSEGQTIEYDGHTYQLNENIVSFCFLGFDKTAMPEDPELHGQADAVIVAALDTSTGSIKLIEISRDSMVDVGVYTDDGTYLRTEKKQICLAFGYGDGKDVSCRNVMDSASRTLYNIPINYYYAMDEGGVGALADAVDGVPLTALQSIPGTGITKDSDVILYGNKALKYVQYRDTSYLTSSLDRQARQIQFMHAFAAKVLSSANGNVAGLVKLYQTANDYSMTNLDANEFLYLATCLISNGITDVSITSLQGTMTQGTAYAEYNLDSDSVYQTVLDTYYTQTS